MSWKPEFKLYASDGVTLVYTFPVVQSTNAPQTVKDMIEITNPRGQGSIIIDGGDAPWDLYINGILTTDETDGAQAYIDLTSSIDDLEDIAIGTPYILQIDKNVSSYYSYRVKRLQSISYEENFRTNTIPYSITLRANSW